jgi:putative hydrolase of HD superfamily
VKGTAFSIRECPVSDGMYAIDLDRFEMASQGIIQICKPSIPNRADGAYLAFEYEKAHDASLQGFFDSSIPKLQHPQVQAWGRDLMTERESSKQNDKAAI